MSHNPLPEGVWCTVEDTYDHDTVTIGPFPDLAAAHRFCDARNAQSVAGLRQKIGDQALLLLVISDQHNIIGLADRHPGSGIGLGLRLGLGSWAYCPEYDREKALLQCIHNPQPCCIDAEAEARALGCKWEYEWMQEYMARKKLDHCWCATLQADRLPKADGYEIRSFLFETLHDTGYLFTTAKHFGDLFRLTCSLCGATVLNLLVECKGYGDSMHSYFTFPTTAELASIDSGTVGPDGYEEFVESRCGIHKVDYEGTFYQRVKVGYLGLDHDRYC